MTLVLFARRPVGSGGVDTSRNSGPSTRVSRFDQLALFFSAPGFHFLFAADGRHDITVAFEIDKARHVVLCGESGECVGLVLEDSVFDRAGHADVEDAGLAGENVDVIDLGHSSRMSAQVVEVCDGYHGRDSSSRKRKSTDVILSGGEAGVRDRTTAGRVDVVEGKSRAACSAHDLVCCIATVYGRRVPRRAFALLRMTSTAMPS
jgi:hypothetical protein